MSYATAITALLAADAPLLAMLTGGVHDLAALGPKGAAELPPTAYTAGHRLRPVALVKGRAVVQTGEVRDDQQGPVNQAVEVWLYDDQSATVTALDTAAQRIISLLHRRPLTGMYSLELAWMARGLRAEEYGDARMSRVEFAARGWA